LKPIAIVPSKRFIAPRLLFGRLAHLLAPAVSFRSDPPANISWAISEADSLELPACKELHSAAVDQRNVLHIERYVVPGSFQLQETLQLYNVLGLDSAT
jgi:hypothetical protein